MDLSNVDKGLAWTELERKTVLKSRIFSVIETRCAAPEACEKKPRESNFTVIESGNWAMVIAVLDEADGRKFIMVRQWRHGSGKISVEFPGGVVEKNEDVLAGAKRELLEETGLSAGKWTKLAQMSPNPAIMSNTMHFFLAEDLSAPGRQNLDLDEFLTVEKHGIDEIIKNTGTPP